MNRSQFLRTSAVGAALSTQVNSDTRPSRACQQADSPRVSNPSKEARVKVGISTYSYWHFRPPKVSIETVIQKASELGVEGVDILHRQMEGDERGPLDAAYRAYCNRLKRQALTSGIDLSCLS